MTVTTAEPMTLEEANRITLRITLKLDTIADNYEAVMPMIREAIERRADVALGYASPGAYVSEKFGDTLSRLGVELRREVVRELTAAGLSTRAIAPVVGVSNYTVHQDRHAGVSNQTPAERIDYATGEILDGPDDLDQLAAEVAADPVAQAAYEAAVAAEPAPKVTGIDGKQYSRPEPRQPHRRPLTDGFRDASLDLGKLITRIENLVNDDRFARNKNEVARYANDLIRARDALQRAIDQMS